MALLQISEPGQSPKPHQFKRAVGIDLGTTNSLVATVQNSGQATVIPDEQGEALLPSVVQYSEQGIFTGKVALRHAVDDPLNTLSSFKRWMGRAQSDIDQDGTYDFVSRSGQGLAGADIIAVNTQAGVITPIEASAEILKSLARRAEQSLGGQLQGAVITVPAYFDDSQRQATKDAATLAGIHVLRLINEPTAAAVAYGLNKADDRCIAVYDLGGGTFDISILQLSEGVFEVLATGGDAALGGDDFDQAIANWALEQAGLQQTDLSAAQMRQLLQDARAAKQALSETQRTGLSIQTGDKSWAGELGIEAFNRLIEPLVQKTLYACQVCLNDAELKVSDIADVVMVGGSTRVPLVREKVAELFGQPPRIDVDPDQVVAQGAAIQADILIGNNRDQDLLLLDVIPLSLGIETMGGLVEKIIPRNASIPCTRAQEFTTYKDGQTALALHVLQGERERVDDCRSLARFELRGIPPMVAGAARIQVTFDVDANGMLAVSAEETTTGVKSQIQVQPSYGLEESQIADMLKASYNHAEQDRDTRMLVEQRIEAQGLIESVRAALQADAALLDDDETDAINQAIEQLAKAIQQDQPAVIKNAIARLGNKTETFAARRMDKSIRQALQGKSVEEVADLGDQSPR